MASPLKAALWQSYAIDLPIEFVPDKSVFLSASTSLSDALYSGQLAACSKTGLTLH
jgi:hypothetical protein